MSKQPRKQDEVIASDPLPMPVVSPEAKLTTRLGTSFVISGRTQYVTVEMEDQVLPDESFDEFSDRVGESALLHLFRTAEEFGAALSSDGGSH